MDIKDPLIKRLIDVAEQRAQEEADFDYEEWLAAQELDTEPGDFDPDQYKDDHT